MLTEEMPKGGRKAARVVTNKADLLLAMFSLLDVSILAGSSKKLPDFQKVIPDIA